MPRVREVRTGEDRTFRKMSSKRRPLRGVKLRPLLTFRIRHAGIRLRVRLFGTKEEIWEAYLRLPRGCEEVNAPKEDIALSFFRSISSMTSPLSGEIALLLSPKLFEYIPHEVSHAVLYYWETPVVADAPDEEEFAFSVGILSAKIFAKVKAFLV